MNKSFDSSLNSGLEKSINAPAKYGARWLEPSSSLAKSAPDGNNCLERGLSTDGLQYRQPKITAIYPTPWSKSLSTRHRTVKKDGFENKSMKETRTSTENLKSPLYSKRIPASPAKDIEQFHSGLAPRRFISVPEGKVSASRQLFDKDFSSIKTNNSGTSWKDPNHHIKEPLFKVPNAIKHNKSAVRKKEPNTYASNTLDLGQTFNHQNTNHHGSENSFFATTKPEQKRKVDHVVTIPNIKASVTIPQNASMKTLSSVASDESGIIMKSLTANKLTEEKCSALKCWSSEKEATRHFFAHYDWQSMTFNFEDAKLATDTLKRKNITTGASKAAAAKLQSAENSPNTSLENLIFIGTENESQRSSNDMLLWCPYFINELGSDGDDESIEINEGGKAVSVQWVRSENSSYSVTNSPTQAHMLLANHKGLSVMEKSGIEEGKMLNTVGFVMEHVDRGALYYKTHFQNQDHLNFFGLDDKYGPIAISLKRERIREINQNNNKDSIWQYRIIVRTSELCTLRGSILEDVLLSQNHPAARGLRPRDVLEYACPEIDINCLKIAQATDAVQKQLMKVDEQNVSNTYKIGVMYCMKGQSTEEDMYNNVDGSPAFEEFLDLLGDRIQLKGFTKFRGGLDVKTNSTGKESYFTSFEGNEIMFHVSTLLPHSKNNRQQLLRKRHVGNDIVTIVFQEPDSKPFSPEDIRSHFQHVFIIVRVYQPCSANTRYRISQTRSQDIPSSTPFIPKQAVFPKSETFREFLLTKIINNENAARNAGKFKAMSMNTRQEYLRDLAVNHCTINPVDNSGAKFTKFSLSVAARRREKGKNKISPETICTGAIVWHVTLKDCGPHDIPCMLGISDYVLALVEKSSKRLIFSIPCQSVIGWSEYSANILHVYYGRGERISIAASSCAACSWKKEVIMRLHEYTVGDTAITQNLRRNSKRQLGFHINYEGIVMDVEQKAAGWQQGKLVPGCRLVEICKVSVVTMTHDEMLDLLRTSDVVNVIMIPPHEDGTPRRCNKSLYHILPEMKNIFANIIDENIHIRSKSDPATKVKRSYVMSSEDLNMHSERSLKSGQRNSSHYGSGQIQSDSEYTSPRKHINFNNSTRPVAIPRQMRRQQSHDVVDSSKQITYSMNTNKSNNESNSFTVPQKRNKEKSRFGNIKHSTSTESGLDITGINRPSSRNQLNDSMYMSKKNTPMKNQYINYKLQNFFMEKHLKSNGNVSSSDQNETRMHRKGVTHRKFTQKDRKLTRTMSDESICGIIPNPSTRSKSRRTKHNRHVTNKDVPLVDSIDNWDQLVSIASKVEDHVSSELKNSLYNGQHAVSDYYSENDVSDKTNTMSSRSLSPAVVDSTIDNSSGDFDPLSSYSQPQSSEAEERLRQIESTLKAIQTQLSEEKRSKQIILQEVEKLRRENTRLQHQAMMDGTNKTYF